MGTLGEHQSGETTAVVVAGIVGFFAGGWSVGGPLSVLYGVVIGAAVGWAALWLFRVAASRRIVGRPVNVADPEVMALVVSLADTARLAAGLDFPDPGLDIPWIAKELTYQVVDQRLADDDSGGGVSRPRSSCSSTPSDMALRAQATLGTITEVPSDRSASPAAAAGADGAAATTARGSPPTPSPWTK